MAMAIRAVKNNNLMEAEYSEQSAIDALRNELSKGVESMKKGEVYTIEEAWEEIDKI